MDIINGNSPDDMGFLVAGAVYEFIDKYIPFEQRRNVWANCLESISAILMTEEGAKCLEKGAIKVVEKATHDPHNN